MAEEIYSKICVELGSTACQRGDYALTYLLYNQGFKQNNEKNSVELASSLQKVGAAYAERKRYKEAAKFLKKALAIYRTCPDTCKNEMRDVLDQLADLCRNQGNFARAAQLYERAMEIEESLKDKDQEKIQNRLNQLAWLHLRQGKIELAQSTYNQASKMQAAQPRSH